MSEKLIGEPEEILPRQVLFETIEVTPCRFSKHGVTEAMNEPAFTMFCALPFQIARKDDTIEMISSVNGYCFSFKT